MMGAVSVEEAEYRFRLERADYRSLSKFSPPLGGWNSRSYIFFRSLVINGDYDCAKNYLDRFHEEADSFEFARLQIGLYRRVNVKEVLERLKMLRGRFANDFYLEAEFHFVLGYTFILLEKWAAAVPELESAFENYRHADLPAPAAVALFNLCVASNHLNKTEMFQKYYRSFEEHFERYPSASTVHHFYRLRAYKKLDSEEYVEASKDFELALSICEENDRKRDASELLQLLAYTYLKLDRDADFVALLNKWRSLIESIHPMMWRCLVELDGVREKGVLSSLAADRLLKKWEDQEGVSLLFLIDVLLHRIMCGQDYEALLRLSRQACEISLERGQALALVDFRYYQIVALIALGENVAALRLLHAYKKDALKMGSQPKMQKVRTLEADIRRLNCARFEGIRPVLELDLREHRILVDQRRFDLSKKPVMEKFLLCLLEARRALNLEAIFQTLYGISFEPHLHESRMNALINRARVILGAGNLIRRESTLALRSTCRKSVLGKTVRSANLEERQGQILDLLQKSGKPLKLKDFEKLFKCSRRTLQADLERLIEKEEILKQGFARKTIYLLNEKRCSS